MERFRIKAIKIKNDSVFGNLELDFSISDNETAYLVLISGDNGIGKTRLLKYLTFDILDIEQVKEVEYEMDFGNTNEFDWELNYGEQAIYFNGYTTGTKKILKPKKIFIKYRPIVKNFAYRIEYGKDANKQIIKKEEGIKEWFNKSFFISCSNVVHDYGKDVSQDIDQILKDIYNKSAKNTLKIINDDEERSISKYELLEDWKKFKKSFNNIFQSNNLVVEKWDDEKEKIILKKWGKTFLPEKASSGEKQIITIFSKIIENLDENNYKIFAFDEIESFLHPDWQSKIIDEIKNLIPKENQIFITTHSPFIQTSIDEKTDIFLTGYRQNNGNIKFQKKKYYGKEFFDSLKIINKSFEDSNFYQIFVSGKIDEKYLKEIVSLFNNEEEIFQNNDFKFMLPSEIINIISKNNSDGDSKQLKTHAVISKLALKIDNIFFLYEYDFDLETEISKYCKKEKLNNENVIYLKKFALKMNEPKVSKKCLDFFEKNKISGIERFLNLENFLDEFKKHKEENKREIKDKNDLKNILYDWVLSQSDENKKVILNSLKDEFISLIKPFIKE